MVRGKNDRRRKPVQIKSKAAKRKPAKAAAEDTNTPVLDATKLRALYAAVLQCRLLGEKLRALAQQGKIPPHSLAPTGREAAIVGTVLHLLPADLVAPSPSLFLASNILGAPAELILNHLRGNHVATEADSGPRHRTADGLLSGAQFHSAAQLHAAAQVALAFKMQQKQAVVLAVVDEDPASPDFWHAGVSHASAHRLPIVFAICTSPNQPALRDKALSLGLPGITVDGHDVVGIFRVAQESIRRAREGHGPTLIECRMISADASREGSGDSLTFMEAYLGKRKLWTPTWKQSLIRQFERELTFKSSARPD